MAARDANTVGDLLAWAVNELRGACESPRLDAELLLAACIGRSRAAVMARPEHRPEPGQARRFTDAVGRRARGEPFAYITGCREFFGLELAVDSNVLVPRPETELLVESVLQHLPDAAGRVLDLGTGSGAIALALKAGRPALEVVAADCSAAALAVAKGNAADLGLAVSFVESNWFDALAGERFAAIVSNPPYVRTADPHFAGALRHEPRLALDGGAGGLDAFRQILGQADAHLVEGGLLAFEHGFDQRDALLALAAERGFRAVAAVDDLAGHARALLLKRTGDG